MIVRDGDCIRVSGAITMSGAGTLLEEGRSHVAAGVACIDLAGVSTADSAALAVLFGWVREARQRQGTLSFRNAPDGLASLAEVYGVSELLAAA